MDSTSNNKKSSTRRERKYSFPTGFTLVELIIVITILSILGTVAFISFSSYQSTTRDSTRLSDITSISKGLSLYNITSGTYPTPDSPIVITAGTGYSITQGTVGSNVLSTIKMSTAKDNLDGNYYSYSIDSSRTHYTIGSFLENNQTSFSNINNPLINTANATDYSKRFLILRGDLVGILTESGSSGMIPIEQSTTNTGTTIDLTNTTKDLTLNISNTNTTIGSGSIVGTIQSLQNGNNNFNAPASCPTGFISVPGNQDFNQPGFCVMKFEAKALNGIVGPTFGTSYQTHDYGGLTDIIVSNAHDYPIATITQPQAISACQSMGAGYHLVTNNEWMTIARNIEQVSNNWSSNIVGSGYIYSGHNDNLSSAITGSIKDSDGYINTGNSSGNQKRTLVLSNGNVIWDLAGNAWEHVNGANTIDGTNFATLKGNVCDTSVDDWNSFGGSDGTQCGFVNGYTYDGYGPKTPNLNAIDNGIGKIWSFSSINTLTDRIFIRGGSWFGTTNVGIFTLRLDWTTSNTGFGVGFRCTK